MLRDAMNPAASPIPMHMGSELRAPAQVSYIPALDGAKAHTGLPE